MIIANHYETCGICHTNKACSHSDILEKFKDLTPKIEKTTELIKRYGFKVISSENMPYPIIRIISKPERMVAESALLLDIFRKHGIILRELSQDYWSPSICSEYDPVSNHANICVLGIDDDMLSI